MKDGIKSMKNEEMIALNDKIEKFYQENPDLATKYFEALITSDDDIDGVVEIVMETMKYFTKREWALMCYRMHKVTDKLDDLYWEDEEFQKLVDDINDEIEEIEDEEYEKEES